MKNIDCAHIGPQYRPKICPRGGGPKCRLGGRRRAYWIVLGELIMNTFISGEPKVEAPIRPGEHRRRSAM